MGVPESTDASLFEALLRLYRPDAALDAQLKAAGVDLDHLARKYRPEQWATAVGLYTRALYPDGDVRRFGRDFAAAFGDTLTGTLVKATLPLIGPARLLERWPLFVRIGRPDVVLTVKRVGPNAFEIHSVDPVRIPAAFNLGLLDYVFETMKVRATLTLAHDADGEARVHCSWELRPAPA